MVLCLEAVIHLFFYSTMNTDAMQVLFFMLGISLATNSLYSKVHFSWGEIVS